MDMQPGTHKADSGSSQEHAQEIAAAPSPDEGENMERTVARNAAVVSGATLVSRVLGFVRDCVVASVLGAGPLADAFFIALRLPNLMRRLFGEGSLSLALIGEFAHTRQQSGAVSAHAMVRTCLVWLLIILGVVCVAAMYWSGPVTAMLAPGLLHSPEIFARTAELVRLCFPYALLICITALCGAVLQARGHFLAPALAPCVFNCSLIAGAAVAWIAGWPVPETLGVALLVAGVLQIALQQPFLARAGFRWRGAWSLKDEGAKRVGRQMLPSVFGAAVYQLSIVLTTMLASLLPEGSISHLYYADRLVQFPLGVFGVAVGTAALPALASLAARGETVRFRTALEDSLRLTLFISLPAAAGLAGMADPIVNILFGRGAFTDTAVQQTVLALWGYAPGLPAFAATRPLIAAFHARRDSATPVAAAVGGLAVTVGGGAVLMQFMGVAGLALAVSLGSWVNVVLLYRLFLRREQCGGFSFRWAAVYLLLSAGVWGAAAYSSFRFGAWSLIAIPVIIVFYAGSAMVCRSPDMRLLLRRQAAG